MIDSRSILCLFSIYSRALFKVYPRFIYGFFLIYAGFIYGFFSINARLIYVFFLGLSTAYLICPSIEGFSLVPRDPFNINLATFHGENNRAENRTIAVPFPTAPAGSLY